jgi:pyridoxine kinase
LAHHNRGAAVPVLSIQSRVSFGYVGNSVAVFALQRTGHEVWPIDTVSYSNHPKHGLWRGTVTDPATLTDLAAGLDDLSALDRCDAVLSGYLGSAANGVAVAHIVNRVRRARSDAFYLCDPVMAHEQDGFFVDEPVRTTIRDDLVPLADAIKPNQVELAFLADRSVATIDEACAACAIVRRNRVGTVLVSSLRVAEIDDDQIATLAATTDGTWIVRTPRLPGSLFGAGDLFAALYLGAWLDCRDVPDALARAVARTFGVLAATAGDGADELRLVEAQDQLVAPTRVFAVERIA